VAGVGAANSTLALAAALGLSLLVGGHPWMLDAVTIGGALYLAVLGLRSIARALGSHGSGVVGGAGEEGATASLRRATPGASFAKGVTTNLLNPSVALFYMTLVPQFIAREDPFLARFTLLCASHVLMAVAWHSMYAWTLGTVSEHLTRPRIRRAMAIVTGVLLVGFGVRLLGRLG